ncbi:toxin-antitoxin system, antitoxin component, Xre family [Roseibium sp. TrichSKD4]|uniref:helix-turn-helix transcriptional regulator n=1 Tax=Roseibium sp. TrichSKD4 TaxID=744980 RepID=UPI0001E57128|nr:helix-turn-helix transcriptional regulator [Roseibium sp. TrichSKD4]EFO28690.1 toxin-antitoxin system, antitoxin component, Xre family [Roseibium sp. TrichSKD4]
MDNADKSSKQPSYSRGTRHGLKLLGSEIRRIRSKRKMTQNELASRVGCSRDSIIAIEAGKPTVAIGAAFEAASVLGIELFGGRDRVVREIERVQSELNLLPDRIRVKKPEFDDDF